MRVSGFLACSIASENFSNEKVESTISSTEIMPVANASIAGLNKPQRDQTKVISFTIVGVKSRFFLDAMVDFKITVPRGFTSFIVSANPELFHFQQPNEMIGDHQFLFLSLC